MFDNNDRASIVRWHENSARAYEHMASEQPEHERFPNLELASWHRRCADDIVNRKDKGEPQGFHGHPFRDAWLASKSSDGSPMIAAYQSPMYALGENS